MKDGPYVINLADKKSKGIHWVSLFIDRNAVVYFDSFEVEYIPEEVLRKIKDKSITHNIFRTQSDHSIMCGFYCVVFIEYMLARKTLLDYTILFLLTTIKRMTKQYISTLRANMTKENTGLNLD